MTVAHAFKDDNLLRAHTLDAANQIMDVAFQYCWSDKFIERLANLICEKAPLCGLKWKNATDELGIDFYFDA